ncbi:MAG TPA: hypothetical protein VK421_06085 [Pyrinomonadaceae bacterium]|nr:hypothetical protein [Pyrinomonadaceae bacterium]
MPIQITELQAEDTQYGYPMLEVLATDVVFVDISDLTTGEVDADGRLKPGVPFQKTGDTVGAGDVLYGVNLEAVKIVADGPTNDSLAANAGTFPVTVGTIGTAHRDVIEDNLGRPLTADEIDAFDAAGSKIHLTRT